MYYLILSAPSHLPAHKQYISFSETNHDVCFGHTKNEIIPNYNLQDYLDEYGNEIIDSYERNEKYELVPCRKTILEVVSAWNTGVKNFKFTKK